MAIYTKKHERLLVNFYRSLDEANQRRYAAAEAIKLGHGGKKYIKELFGISYDRISRGLEELSQEENLNKDGRIRKKGGGRKGKKTTHK